MHFEVWYLIPTLLFVINIIITIIVVRKDDFTKFQKMAQIILVWLIPCVAAIIVWLAHRGIDGKIEPYRSCPDFMDKGPGYNQTSGGGGGGSN